MGVSILSMTFSQRLKDLVEDCEAVDTDQWDGRSHLQECCDMTSTAGYDNDGSTGPEILDNGVELAFSCRDYDPKAVIFYAFGEQDDSCFTTAYYVFGRDEDDAIRRLRDALGADFLAVVADS